MTHILIGSEFVVRVNSNCHYNRYKPNIDRLQKAFHLHSVTTVKLFTKEERNRGLLMSCFRCRFKFTAGKDILPSTSVSVIVSSDATQDCTRGWQRQWMPPCLTGEVEFVCFLCCSHGEPTSHLITGWRWSSSLGTIISDRETRFSSHDKTRQDRDGVISFVTLCEIFLWFSRTGSFIAKYLLWVKRQKWDTRKRTREGQVQQETHAWLPCY
jgi:hypothetical protein